MHDRPDRPEILAVASGVRVVSQPIGPALFDVAAWLAQLASYRDIPFPEALDDPPLTEGQTLIMD